MGMGLQIFIEQNAGKVFGDKYLFESSILSTRHPFATGLHIIEVCLHLPWVNFSHRFDDREVRDNVEFYHWLVGSFFPLAKKRIGVIKRRANVGMKGWLTLPSKGERDV